MHPILGRLDRTAAYAGAWFVVALLLSVSLTRQGAAWVDALVFVVPTFLLYGFICLSSFYVCRALPLTTTRPQAVAIVLAVSALVGGVIWLTLAEAWMAVLRSVGAETAAAAGAAQEPFLFSAAVILFLLVLSVHYIAVAVEAARAAERQQLELQVLTREAELRALRAQINPHFLYNSLNSISALTSIDPPGARRMCMLLGDFLRSTLKMSALARITVAEELAVVDAFIDIEQIRFGARLGVDREIDAAAIGCRLPPLLLQPLLENAVVHGVAGLIDGGVIHLTVARRDGRLVLVVENPRDPDVPPRAHGGHGLESVRRRLDAAFPDNARIDAVATRDGFRVELNLPCEE